MIPCYNEQESLPLLYKALSAVMEDERISSKYDFEVMLVNDGYEAVAQGRRSRELY